MNALSTERRVGGLSLEAFSERHGPPAQGRHHPSDEVLEERRMLSWACSCVASYVSDTISDAKLDLHVEDGDRHGRAPSVRSF
jgi:hypothetical protein